MVRTCARGPSIAFLVLRAEGFLALAVLALSPVVRAVVKELGFALLRLAEGLMRDKNATAAITGDLGESPVTNNVTRLVVDVVVAEHHPVADRTVVIVLAPANRAGMAPA